MHNATVLLCRRKIFLTEVCPRNTLLALYWYTST